VERGTWNVDKSDFIFFTDFLEGSMKRRKLANQKYNAIEPEIGENIRLQWRFLADKYKLNISIQGIPSISIISFNSDNNIKYKTLITQELLKSNILASNLIYVCIDHDPDTIERYIYKLDNVFHLIKQCEDGEKNIDDLLEWPVSHTGLNRLN